MTVDGVHDDDLIPCPQCGGRGTVPHGSGQTWARCPTCKAKPITLVEAVEAGWSYNLLAEVYPALATKAAGELLIEDDGT